MIEKLIAAFLALFKGSPKELDDHASEAGLSPRTSIVDLLKAHHMDSSFMARGDLWRDLGHTEPYHGTPEQNTELHRAVMAKLGLV